MTFEQWWKENKRRVRESRLKDAVCEAWHDGYRAGWLAHRLKIEQQEADAEGYRNGQVQAQEMP